MADLPEGFHVGDLYVFPVGPPGADNFGYIPGAPAPELSGGNAKASLLSSPNGAVLAMQAVWEAPDDAVNAARVEIASRQPDSDPASVNLSVASIDDTMATLTLTGTNGRSHTFGPKETSGPDAYRVVFSESLTVSEKLAVIGAFRGQTGVLKLSYAGTLTLDESASVEITGDLAAQLKALAPKPPEEKKSTGGFWGKKKDPDPPAPPPPPDAAACAAAVDSAIANGEVKVNVARTANVSDAIVGKLQKSLLQRVAKQLFDKLTQMGADAAYMSSFTIRQQASDSERKSFPVVREADPAPALGQNGGGRLVTEAGTPLPEPVR